MFKAIWVHYSTFDKVSLFGRETAFCVLFLLRGEISVTNTPVERSRETWYPLNAVYFIQSGKRIFNAKANATYPAP